ncbi:MAG: class I SAM-dependent methyltransferase [Solirubrobacteraceae bacterium]
MNIALLRRWLPAGQGTLLKTDLFDEAVGSGLYPELASRVREVAGVDVSAAAVQAVTERYPDLDARVADVLELPFADASFDVVVSNSTLDHFKTHAMLRRAHAELARVLRPGGELIITLDNRENPIVALRTSPSLDSIQRRLGIVPYFVGATHGTRGLLALLRSTGFDVTEVTTIMHCPPQLAARIAARRDPGNDQPALMGRHLRRVLRYEALGRWPTRRLTGHFVAARARKL